MVTTLECVPCLARQVVESVTMSTSDSALREQLVKTLLREIADADWRETPVAVTQRMQRLVRSVTGKQDPYALLKKHMNRVALELRDGLTQTGDTKRDLREAAVRLAIAGNLLDSGAKNRLEPDELPAMLEQVWEMPLVGSVNRLFAAAEKARHILYLADNAGEIVFDRLLVAALPTARVTVAVRGFPVLNDATIADAEIAGLTNLVTVVGNGSDAPGTILEETSEEFRRLFDRSDLIVSKGQGNFETLSDHPANIYFLLTVKCPAIGREIGAPVGALVAKSLGAET